MSHQSDKVQASITYYSPEPEKKEKDNEDWEPQSLEEALLGEPAGEDSY